MKRLLSNGRYHECRGTRCLLKAKFRVSIQKLEIEQCTIESKTANTLYRAIGNYTISRFTMLVRKNKKGTKSIFIVWIAAEPHCRPICRHNKQDYSYG